MKKKYLIKICCILIACLNLCSCSKRKGTIIEITLAELLEKFRQNETFSVLLTREACEVCEASTPVYIEVIDDLNEEAYHVYFTVKWLFTMDGTNSDAFYELLDYIGKDIPALSEGFDVPLALYVKDGKIIYHIMGYDFEDPDAITKEEHQYQYNLYAKGFTLIRK